MSEFETQTQTETNVAENAAPQIDSIISPDELKKLQEEADNYVDKLSSENRADLSKVLDQLTNLGDKEQRSAGESLRALQTPVKSMMNGKNDEIAKTLLELRKVAGELNTSDLNNRGLKGIFNKVLRINPFEKYVHKYQSVKTQIDSITRSLLIGKDMLQEDSVGLQMMQEDAFQKIYELDKQIYLGIQLSKILEEEVQKPERIKDKPTINEALETILMRTRNLEESKIILRQSIGAIDIARKTNKQLMESIRNAYTKVKNVIEISTMITLALNNQVKVMEAVDGTNALIDKILLENSKQLKDNTIRTQKMLENPSTSLSVLKESFNNILDAVRISEESQARIIQSSKSSIEELETLDNEMKRKLSHINPKK